MDETISRVKTHVKNHQKAYLIGGGAAGTLIFIKKFPAIVINDVGNIKVNSPTINQITIEIPKPGNSGNMIYCAKDGVYYPSQRSLAKALGENTGTISQLINEKIPDTKGYGLVKVAENGVQLAQ